MKTEKKNPRREFLKYSAASVAALSIAPRQALGCRGLLAPVGKDNNQSIRLLVRADDMGIKYDRTLAIIKAHKEGIVTSASLMPTTPFFEDAVRMCKETPTLTAGIHVTLLGTRRRTVLPPEKIPSILTPEGFLYETGDELSNANPNVDDIEKEIRAQIAKVRASGLYFVYLDHHRDVPGLVREVVYKLCLEQDLIYGEGYGYYGLKRIELIPESWPRQQLPDGRFVYYDAPALNEEQQQLFFDRLANLEPGNWITVEHPGFFGPERNSVTELLCSSKTRDIIKRKNIQLVNYFDLWGEEFL